jgi:hypothetical protein
LAACAFASLVIQPAKRKLPQNRQSKWRLIIKIPANYRSWVGAGFMPAFKFKQKIVFEFERGHKARAYKATQRVCKT